MMITGTGAVAGVPYQYRGLTAKAGGDSTNGSAASGDGGSATGASSASATTPRLLSTAGLPLITMPAELFAQMHDPFSPPDPAKTAAQDNDRAYSVARDAATGKILGGVWPDAGIVSSGDIAADDRLGQTEDWTKVSQYLAGDIEQASGRSVTIQYFKPGDPNAPTFGSHPWTD